MTTEYNTSICQLIYIPLLVLQVSGMLMWNNDPLGCYNANGTPTIKNGIDFDSADHSRSCLLLMTSSYLPLYKNGFKQI